MPTATIADFRTYADMSVQGLYIIIDQSVYEMGGFVNVRNLAIGSMKETYGMTADYTQRLRSIQEVRRS